MIEPFSVDIPQATLDDLRARLDRTRWPVGVTDSGGLALPYVRELIRYWRDDFDWELQQAKINRFRQYRAAGVHFIHEPSDDPRASPLLLLHGWPGSFVEMLDVVPLLRRAFHVVVPSLPGYGFSDPPASAGMSNERIAELCAELMTALGYERFFVQGGDWGAGIGTWLARKFPERVRGLHLNYIPGSFAPAVDGDVTAEERASLEERDRWVAESGAYGAIQRTRPLTLAYGLADSPAGLAAWIAEKFEEWADPASDIGADALLTNITIYWATNTIASSMRLYLESVRTPLRFARGERIAVPCAVARFPLEAPFPPRSWVERVYDVRRWTEMPRGGHFAAMEAPALLADDVIAFAMGG